MPGNRVFRIDTGTASPLPGRDSSGRGLPRRRTMKVVKILLTLVVVVGVLGGAAYGAGRLVDHRHPGRVASTSDLPQAPASSAPSAAGVLPHVLDRPQLADAPGDRRHRGAEAGRAGPEGARPAAAPLPARLAAGDHHRGVRRGHGHRGQGLPGQARAAPQRRPRRSDVGPPHGDDVGTDPRRDVQRDAPGPDALRDRRPGPPGPGDPGAAAADRLVLRRRHRRLRLRDRDRDQGLPGQARHPGHRRRRPAHAGPAHRDDDGADRPPSSTTRRRRPASSTSAVSPVV